MKYHVVEGEDKAKKGRVRNTELGEGQRPRAGGRTWFKVGSYVFLLPAKSKPFVIPSNYNCLLDFS
jgi:hypothetical protein